MGWGRPICRREGWSIINEREAPGGTDEEAEGRDELSIGKVIIRIDSNVFFLMAE